MEEFLYYLLRASVVLTLFYTFYKLFFAKNTFHSANRLILISIVFLTAFLPLVRFNLLPITKKPVSEPLFVNISNLQISESVATQQTGVEIPWIQILIALFTIGLIFSSLRYLIGVQQISKIIDKSEKHFSYNNVKLAIADRDISPFSWLNNIVLSRHDFESNNSDAIIQHEKAHIHLKHSIDLIIFDLFTCIFWFNPLSWLLRREIQSVHEYQADQLVLNNGINVKQYQLLLIRKSVGEEKFAMANNLRHRSLHKRITMMMKTKSNNNQKWNYAIAVPVLFLAVITLSLPTLNAKVINEAPAATIVIESNAIKGDTPDLPKSAEPVVQDTKPLKVVGYRTTNINNVDTNKVKRKSSIEIRYENDSSSLIDGNPVYVLDEKRVDHSEIKNISPNDIQSISVLKGKAATDVYGEEGKDGVIIIESNPKQIKDKPESTVNIDNLENKPLFIVDGKKMPQDFNINTINSKDIKAISVLKDNSTLNYGEEAKHGVIVISTFEAEQD